MKKTTITLFLAIITALSSIAQTNSNSSRPATEKEKNEILDNLKIDTTKLLGEISDNACKCIDSIKLRNQSRDEVVKNINKCIDEQTGAYQLGVKAMNLLKSSTEKKSH